VEKTEKDLDSNGKERIYSSENTRNKIYLKKSVAPVKAEPTEVNGTPAVATTGQEVSKFPIISNFQNIKGSRNLLVLPKYELEKMARRAGKYWVNGFHHQAKNNISVWPYPCPRPLFRNCWMYRTFNLNSFACLALQLRIIWTCMRWDDMQTKPPTTDGKNQITTETEILTTELLKHRFCGLFMEKTQFLRRKILITLELPKTVREMNPIRSGLRKRKRAESPVQTEPQVSEEWIDEDKLELWEIKQYGEKQDKVNMVPITRTSTGKLPAPKSYDPIQKTIVISNKQTPEQIKEKMEEQLRIQRAIRNQKRAEDLLNNKSGKILFEFYLICHN
jgi:nucleosome-remodeling factor subunit BPTF